MIEHYRRRLIRFWRMVNQRVPPLGISLLLHLLLFGSILLAGISTLQERPPRQSGPVIRAHAIDGAELKAREERKRQKREQAERREREKRAALKRKNEQEQARKREKREKAERLKKKRAKEQAIKEEKARKAAKKKRADEKKKKAQQEKLKKKKEREKARKRAEKKKAEQRRVERHKAAKRAAEQKKLQQQLLLEAEMELEQQLLSGEQQSRAERRELSRIRTAIRQQIERVWRKPRNTPAGRLCRVSVVLLPDGGVGRVTIVSSSGNQPFDRSVERAVHEAAPFPLPEAVELRAQVRELEMTFVHQG